jgi:hypothetical protein
VTNAELIGLLEKLRAMMISTATGGPRIGEVNDEFRQLHQDASDALAERGVENGLPFDDSWTWHGRWSAGDLPSYQSRRAFVNQIFSPLIARVRQDSGREFEATGWDRVDRTILKVKTHLAAAKGEEDYQTVGLNCREGLISLAQVVWNHERHPSLDQTPLSPTDAKRKLEAFIAVELATNANEQARKHARAALDLAVGLQHKRSANWRDAAMCLEATTSVVNLIAIVQGRRDPTWPSRVS